MISVDFSLSGDLGLPYVRRLASGRWRSPLMASVAQMINDQTKRRVASEKTSPQGARWAPRKDRPKNKTVPGGLLVRSGRMLAGFTASSTVSEAISSNMVPYSGFHQEGTSRMVARAFHGVSGPNAVEIERLVAAQLGSF